MHIFFFVILLALLWVVSAAYIRERTRRKGRPFFDFLPIPVVSAADIAPVFASTPLGPSLASEVFMIGESGREATTSEREAWILCALAKSAFAIFEFGTATGRTTYLLAKNSPPQATVTTLTLRPEDVTSYQGDKKDSASDVHSALNESAYTKFYYQGTPVENKITQLYGDSKAWDETPLKDTCDLIFIDGSHAHSYVQNDTEKALRMVKAGGYILWHDYSPRCAGVYRYLNSLGKTLPLKHIKGTRLVAYKHDL